VSEGEVVVWDRAMLERFKAALVAREPRDEPFAFEGHDFDPGYARYLIEYLEGRLA
jgi:hypothetical protein